jgi:hypothetical protein
MYLFFNFTYLLGFSLNPSIMMPKFSKYHSFFKKKKSCKDLGVDHNLTKFVKILTLEYLEFFYIYIFKNKGILKILARFNRKS